MGLFGKFRSAEQQGREAAWLGLTRARNSPDEAQSRLRRKMRIHPRSTKPQLPIFVSLQGRENPAELAQPIITINGEDLPREKTETPEEQVA